MGQKYVQFAVVEFCFAEICFFKKSCGVFYVFFRKLVVQLIAGFM